MQITTWRKVPLLLIGYAIQRWEKPGGGDFYVASDAKSLQILAANFEEGGVEYGPTHLQYKSKWGFLITWPLCFHFWYQVKPQQTALDKNGVLVTVPGSETVILVSIGWARWDAGNSCYMIPRCYIGGHWD